MRYDNCIYWTLSLISASLGRCGQVRKQDEPPLVRQCSGSVGGGYSANGDDAGPRSATDGCTRRQPYCPKANWISYSLKVGIIMSNLTRILLYFYISLSSTFVYASVINITETVNLYNNLQNSGNGSFYEPLEQGPVKISNGDKVVLNIDFMGKQALKINDDGLYESLVPMLWSNNNLSSFSISNVTVKLLGFTGTGGATVTHILLDHNPPDRRLSRQNLRNFLSGGQSVTFGGLKVTYDVNSIEQSPNTYFNLWLLATSETGVSVTNTSTVQPLAVPKQNASNVFGMPLVGTGAINLTTQAGGVSSAYGDVKDRYGNILSSGYFDYYHQPNQAYYAIDLSSSNASVVAAKSGTVVSINGGSSSGYGYKCANASYNCIVIDHGNGLFSEYREFTDAAINPKTGKYYKIGDAVDEGGVIGKLKGGHLHFQVMTFDKGTGLFSSSQTDNNKVLENVTIGGVKLTDYKLDGNFQVTPSGNTYTVTGTPLKHLISNATTQSSLSLVNSNTINSSVSGSGGSMKRGLLPTFGMIGWFH